MRPESIGDFPPGFFDRADPNDDALFYGQPRLVHHIDGRAIESVGKVYAELGATGRVLDLMSSWVSHLQDAPEHLTVLGMNAAELDANPMADERVVHDLNTDPALPFADDTFDQMICTVSVDYLTRPVDVFRDLARVLRPGGTAVCTFSNRLFPTKAIQGWLASSDHQRCGIVADYFRVSGGWTPATMAEIHPVGSGGDPLWAVWAEVA